MNTKRRLNRWSSLLLLLAASVLLQTGCGESSSSGQGPASSESRSSATQTVKTVNTATGDVPFQLTLETLTVEGYPGLHSFGMAQYEGKLVLFAGRTNGLHGFPPNREEAKEPSFPKEYANKTIYVIDVEGQSLKQASIESLPAVYKSLFMASNVEYAVRDGWLYVIGGYGPDPSKPNGALLTLPYVSVVDLEALVTAVENGTPLDQSFADAHMANSQQPAAAVCGGDLKFLGDLALLVFGQQFDGEYSQGSTAFQQYSNAVRVFNLSASPKDGGVDLTVNFQGTVPANTNLPPDNPYHRRDLTVKSAVTADGQPQVVAYGGVFKGGKMEGYLEPIYIDSISTSPGISLKVDTSAQQLLSQYDCAGIVMNAGETLYTTFFGGISYYYWDGTGLKHDPIDLKHGVDGVPFINSISTFKVVSSGEKRTSAQFLHRGATFPPADGQPVCGKTMMPYLGAETEFVIQSDVPQYSNGVIKLNEIKDKIVIGYLIGGIAAEIPYASSKGNAGTCASNLIYRVTLDPNQSTPTIKLQAPSGE